MEYLIQKYLKENNLTGINGVNYTLRDNLDDRGVYIDTWSFDLPKPKFTEAEKDNSILEKAKENKITQLKKNRDISLEEPMSSIKAIEFDTDKEVYFEFRAKSTGNYLTEPATIIFQALTHDLKYSCYIIEGESKRKGYINMTKTVAEKLRSHLQLRATTNIQYKNDIEKEILSNECDSIKKLNKIDINFK